VTAYYRPIAQTDRCRPVSAQALAGGWSWFSHLERLQRGSPSEVIPASEVPEDLLAALTRPRHPVCGLSLDEPRLMGVLNTTPDSFSDGNLHHEFEAAVARARQMAARGADLIDIGGESTRPGSDGVASATEISRTEPVIAALRASGLRTPLSIDTRKADVARAALGAGAQMLNDVTALGYDVACLPLVAISRSYVCLMHASGDPKTMQDDPQYDDVLLDVYDYLAARVQACRAAGVPLSRIVVDPGIGFGKTLDHNLCLIRGLSLFHGLGCAVLLGVSRKRFIGTLGHEPNAADRGPGSIALALEGLRQGVQMIRVHDIKATKQAVALWKATL
jgi:dihydropteroate synthase